MNDEVIEKFGDTLTFSSVYGILKNKVGKKDFHETYPYRINYAINYIEEIMSSLDDLKHKNFTNGHSDIRVNMSRYYGIDILESDSGTCFIKDNEIDYVNDNLENARHQLSELKNNPEGFYSRGDPELTSLIGSIKLSVDKDYHDAGEPLRRELELDD